SSTTSKDDKSIPSGIPSPKAELPPTFEEEDGPMPPNAVHADANHSRSGSYFTGTMSGDEADTEIRAVPTVRDFVTEGEPNAKPRHKKSKRKHGRHRKHAKEDDEPVSEATAGAAALPGSNIAQVAAPVAEHQVAFADITETVPPVTPGGRRAFPMRPTLPAVLSHTVFTQPQPEPTNPYRIPMVPRSRSAGLRRTSSLPNDLRKTAAIPGVPTNAPVPPYPERVNSEPPESTHKTDSDEHAGAMSRTAAVVLLLASTALVAVCAEFMVDAIPEMIADSPSVSQAFIGLIVLPIVGNAAEHVTAVTVATRNKMDLAIGVAIGSSIQIAIFVTPLVVILGWCMEKDMSLYFNLFETVSLFVTAFVVNFLILDGRSNYLEGALLMAAYLIIAVAAFYYPDTQSQSDVGGKGGAGNDVRRMLM
ncbi:hypothetical protein LTS18_013203, partial [Coniosporium uncinatum]